tara:strand:+ start:582 stop:731 length:150 start_codon:yes stop_codon:yes gene_type:complete
MDYKLKKNSLGLGHYIAKVPYKDGVANHHFIERNIHEYQNPLTSLQIVS